MADDTRQIAVRLDPALLNRIDERAAKVGLSRNAWLTKAVEWALDQPTRVRTITTKERI